MHTYTSNYSLKCFENTLVLKSIQIDKKNVYFDYKEAAIKTSGTEWLQISNG